MMPPAAKRKLTLDDVMMIREAVKQREDLRRRASRLSNQALADRLGVHRRTVEKAVAGETWGWSE